MRALDFIISSISTYINNFESVFLMFKNIKRVNY